MISGPSLHDARQGERFLDRVKALELEHRNRRRPHPFVQIASLPLLRHWVASHFRTPATIPPSGVSRPNGSDMNVHFIGHNTVSLLTTGVRAIVDPFFDGKLWGMKRAVPPCLADADRADVNLILLTGADPDRHTPTSLRLLPRHAKVVAPAALAPVLASLGFLDVQAVQPGDLIAFNDVQISVVPSRHDGAGYPWSPWQPGVGYVVQGVQVAVYCSGATGYFSGFSEIGRTLRPDVAVLPISGYEPDALRRGRLSPLDAFYAWQDLGARLCVPVGFGSFAMGYEPFDEPLRWLGNIFADRAAGAETLQVLAPGGVLRVQRQGFTAAAPPHR